MSKPKQAPTSPPRINVLAAARMFAAHGVIISRDTVRRLAKAGTLDAVRVGKQLLITPASVQAAAEAKA